MVLYLLDHVERTLGGGLDAEAATRNAPRAFTNYRALLENWRAQIAKIEAATGFVLHRKTPAVQQTIDAFLTEGLRHQTRKPEDVQRSPQVANIVRETFEIFESCRCWCSQ